MLMINGGIMKQEIIANTIEIFSKVKDKRQVLKIRQLLGEVLLVVFLATMSDCSEDYEDMELFGKHRLEFLRQFYPYKNGAPSDSTICRVMQMIDPTRFQELFYEWVGVVFGEKIKAATSEKDKDIIPIDGKAIKGCRKDRKSLYMLNVFSHKLGIIISSTEVGEKTNEITALKEVLEILDVKNRIITTDAMGCQSEVAKKIVDKEGDYLFGLKGNQGCTLNDTIKSFEELKEKAEVIEKTNKGHGRLEHKV